MSFEPLSQTDEMLLAQLFPTDAVASSLSASTAPSQGTNKDSNYILIALLVALVIVIIGVDVFWSKKFPSRTGSRAPPVLQLLKFASGLASFYLTYYSLRFTLGSKAEV